MEVFLIRHGESYNNALEDLSKRHEDPPLTEKGERQAHCAAAHLSAGEHLSAAERAQKRPFLDQLYCSPMLRALQTAQPIGEALGLRPEVWVELHEMGGIFLEHGDGRGVAGYPGQTQSEILARFPDYILPPAVGREGWWETSRGMEPLHEGRGRALGVAAALHRRAGEESRIGLVSHGGFMSALIKALGNQLPNERIAYTHHNTAITRIHLAPEEKVLFGYVNHYVHLPEELLS